MVNVGRGRGLLPSLRLLPAGYAVVYMAVLTAYSPTVWDWSCGVGSALLLLGGGRWPLPVLAGQAVFLAVAAVPGVAPAAHNLVALLASGSLAELVLRRSGWQLWLGLGGAVVVTPVYTAGPVDHPVDVVTAVLRVCGAVGLPALVGGYLRMLRHNARNAAERAEQSERLRASEVRAARSSERVAVARELHDVVAHHVSSMVLRAGTVRHASGEVPSAMAAALDDVRATGVSALADLRRLVTVLREEAPTEGAALVHPEGLLPELLLALDRLRRAGIEVDADLSPRLDELDALRRLIVLRTTQEALTNVLKHAGGGVRVWVTASVDDDGTAVVEVRDNGQVPWPAGRNTGHGLIGMLERVEMVGGQLAAGPDGAGWRVRAALPVPGEAPR